jgi:hypothetical protein
VTQISGRPCRVGRNNRTGRQSCEWSDLCTGTACPVHRAPRRPPMASPSTAAPDACLSSIAAEARRLAKARRSHQPSALGSPEHPVGLGRASLRSPCLLVTDALEPRHGGPAGDPPDPNRRLRVPRAFDEFQGHAQSLAGFSEKQTCRGQPRRAASGSPWSTLRIRKRFGERSDAGSSRHRLT